MKREEGLLAFCCYPPLQPRFLLPFCFYPFWHIYIARGPKCNPQSAKGPPALQSASIRNPPCETFKIASGLRSLNCTGPGKASNSVPEAPE
eukprot:1408173-Alexandrium_andersonii.AAC.1